MVVVDEHVRPDVKARFEDAGLRTIASGRDRRYQGRDERVYP